MDVAIINPFIAAATNVFATMLKMQLRLSTPFVRQASERANRRYRVSAVIALGGGVSGVVVLNLPGRLAMVMASALAGTPFTDLSPDCCDALRELVNMIAGNAKKDLPAGRAEMALPTLLASSEVCYPPGVPVVVIPFDTPAGRFALEVAMTPATEKAAA
jgi:chemotaxis protein CheX